MRYLGRPLRRAAVFASLLGLGLFLAYQRPARAQAQDPRPQWMRDSSFTDNRYLRLWEYFTSGEVTKFEVWTQLGDPEDIGDDFRFFFNPMQTQYVVPWGSRLLSAPHPPYSSGTGADQRPYANLVTIRLDDTTQMTGVRDLEFPQDGTAVLGPPIAPLPRGQGFDAPYLFENSTLQISQKTQFARDLVRIEYTVKNIGTVTRSVGIRLLLDSYVDYWGITRSVFLPSQRLRIFRETDFGTATGTTTRPIYPFIPDRWLLLDNDEGDPIFTTKGIVTGNGATTPTRFAIVNTLNLFPPGGQAGTWDYSTDRQQELRISDIGFLYYWNPVAIAAGQERHFVTYAGVGAADHGMSNAYLTAQTFPNQLETQGYIGAVQTPFALPLLNGDADVNQAKITAFVQNEYHTSNLPNAFAILDLPDGLEFAAGESDPTLRRSLGSLAAVGDAGDEGSGSWLVQPNGVLAGLLPINVTFSNGFLDSTRVTREINVPQGRKYQFTDDWFMVTFPFNYLNLQDDPATVLGLAPGSFQIVRYNPQTQQYEQVNRIRPGEGYWIRMLGLGPTFVRLANAAPVKLNTTDTFTSPITFGWNQVGNPSPYYVTVKDLGFLGSGGVIITFDQAIAAGFIRPDLYSYDRKTKRYVKLNRDSTLQPGQGIWVFSNAERNIVWPAPQGPEISITP